MFTFLSNIGQNGIISSLLSKLAGKAEANKGTTNLTTLAMGLFMGYMGIDAAQVADLLRTLADYISKVPTQ